MKIIWTHRSEKDLEGLEKHIAERIIKKVEDAAEFPEHYLSPLKGYYLYKIRAGDYRIVVSTDNDKMVVITTDHRSNVYKSLDRFYESS